MRNNGEEILGISTLCRNIESIEKYFCWDGKDGAVSIDPAEWTSEFW